MNPDAGNKAKPEDEEAVDRPAGSASWKQVLGLIFLGLWILVLAAYGLDRGFGLGFFPTKLERRMRDDVAKLTDTDPEVARKAEADLFSYHGFAVPALIRGLKSGDAARQKACAACLSRIAAHYYGATPRYGVDAGKWARWWAKIDREMAELIDREAQRIQDEMQQEAKRQEH